MNQRPQEPVRSPNVPALPLKANLAGGKVLAGGRGIWQPLYDTLLFEQGTVYDDNPTTFFAQGFAAGRNFIDTNIAQGGKLPGGTTFSLRGFAVKMVPQEADQVVAADVLRFAQGLFTFLKGDSPQIRLHNINLGGLGGFSGPNAAGAAIFQVGSFATGDYFRFPHPDYWIGLPAEINFAATMNWRAGALAWTPVISYYVTVYLIGDYTAPIDY